MAAEHADQDNTQATLQENAKCALPAMSAMARPTLTGQLFSTTIMVKDAPRATTAQKVPSRQLNAHQALSTQKREKRRLKTANCANLALSRTSGVRSAVKSAVNLLIPEKVSQFVTVLAQTVLTQLRMPLAVVRVASISSMRARLPRVTSVT